MITTNALYIGADNLTGELDIPRIVKIMSKTHEGFTIIRGAGFWMGGAEESAVVIVSDTEDSIMESVLTLKSELGQDAIGVQELPSIRFV